MSQEYEVIKTTARFQEPNEPNRQRPILKISDGEGRTRLAHLGESNELANNVRASIDSGRDNPFRPDGEIYRMTDPIVDFYKFGPNGSRAQTPTYAELNGTRAAKGADKQSKKSASRLWRKKNRAAPAQATPISAPNQRSPEHSGAPAHEGSARKESCWRRWFCCRCCCASNGKQKATSATEAKNSQLGANIDHYNKTAANETSSRTPAKNKSQDLISKSQATVGPENSGPGGKSEDSEQRPEQLPPENQLRRHQELPATTVTRQTRVVILDEPDERNESRNIAEASAQHDNGGVKITNGAHLPGRATSKTDGPTAPTSANRSRCVVS